MPEKSLHSAPIRSDFADDPEMIELVEYFVADMPTKADAIVALFDEGRTDELRRLAHQLKGAAGGYGFPVISEAASQVERALCADSVLGEIRAHVEELVDLCRRATT